MHVVLFKIFSSKFSYCIADPIAICHPASGEEIKSITAKNHRVINSKEFQVYDTNFYEIVKLFSSHFTRGTTLRKVTNKSFGQTWRGVLVGWAGGWYTPKNKRVLLLKHFWNFPEA